MPRGDSLSSEIVSTSNVRPGIENLETRAREPSVGSQYAVKHECNNAIPLLPSRFAMRGERKVPLTGGAGYIWGVSLIKRAALSATRCTGGENGRGARVTGV